MKQADVNLIITELDAPSPIGIVVDYETDSLKFHRVNIGLGMKFDADPVAEDSTKSDADNADRSLNILYGIGAPQDSNELHYAVEVLSLQRWSKD